MPRPLLPPFRSGIDLPADGPTVILFHGYTGTPYDLSPLAYFLNEHGYAVHVPLLLGHGTSPQKLTKVTAQKWLNQANETIQKQGNKPFFLGGLSMGALLAIIAAKKSSPQGLILISPSIRLNFSGELVISSAKLGFLAPDKSFAKIGGESDINDPEGRKKCPSYKEMPVFGLVQLEELRLLAKACLPDLTMPIFAAFGAMDGSINTSGSRETLIKKTKQNLSIKSYANSRHVLPLDYDRDALADDVWQFIKSCQGHEGTP